MSGVPHARLLSRALVLALALVALAGLTLGSAGSGAAAQTTGIYVVQMLQSPAVAYNGDVAGLASTKPAKGEKIDPDAAAVVKYGDYLKGQHDRALDAVGGGQKLYDYLYTYNGFSARLTPSQAVALTKQEDVLAVSKDQLVEADTSSTPEFLGLTGPTGLWAQLGGPSAPRTGGGAGENIVIGIVDSGIWPESKSFSDRDASGKLVYQPLNTAKWHGKKCAEGEAWDTGLCNKKLVAARYYNAAWGGSEALEADRPWEFMSPRDYNGHGTHTASTAGGNYGVPTTGPAAVFGPVSGMAPRARIAAYKALWSTQDGSTASGRTSDLVAAIDQAVADGVDVINYSISGTTTNFLDPVQVAFLFAADAGVFVSASAGNSGPTTGTVAHPGPWLTTVAAGTHNRNGSGSVTLGNDVTYTGASVASAVGPAPLVDSVDVGLEGADPTEVELCYASTNNEGNPVLDPAKVAGKIVLCKRGVIARVDKSAAVLEAGGVGMIMYNDPDSSLNADFHFVPSVHVDKASGLAIKAYIAGAGSSATARINASTLTYSDPAPFTASFSSRGPLSAGGGDLLKPDVIAPGQDILAAVAPPGNHGLSFNLLSGTSMSAPHVAGLAALLKQYRPGWSPLAIKSALMTTGIDVLDGGAPGTASNNPVLIFRQGAGHVRPTLAADPGLVFESGFNDWLGFLCGTGQLTASYCPSLKIDPSDLNVASIAIGDLAGTQTVTRTVRNVGSTAATYTATLTGLTGVTTDVDPFSLTLSPGQSGSFTVSFERTTATLSSYTTPSSGQLTWSDGTHSVRIPIVTRPVALAAPPQVSGTGDPIEYDVKFGYDGTFTAAARGLIPATTFEATVADDPGDSFSPGGPGTVSFDVTVPAGSTYARFSLFNDFTDGEDDLDLYVYRCSGDPLTCTTRVGSSGGGTSDEQVNLVNPTAATYRVWVHGFATDGPDSNFTLFTWVLGTADAGNMTVTAPSTATIGATETIELTFSGLSAGTKYLGSVAYSGVAGLPNPTIVRVDTP